MLVTEGFDAGAIWHYGDPLREQRLLLDRSQEQIPAHFPRFTVSGAQRLARLHALTTQDFTTLKPGEFIAAYVLNKCGHIVGVLFGVDDGEVFHGATEPGHLDDLLSLLSAPITSGIPAMICSSETEPNVADAAGLWASEAQRIAAGRPRIFLDTDATTIPNEVAMPVGDRLGSCVQLRKDPYVGQDAVVKAYQRGELSRRLTRLLLDGSADRLPAVAADVLHQGQVVGRMGSSAIHYELGSIGLALLACELAVDAILEVEGIAASQQVIVSSAGERSVS